MITVKELIKFLKTYNQDSEVRWNDGSEIKNILALDGEVILSDHKAIGTCYKCNHEVYKEKILCRYTGYCLVCDENLYKHEILFNDKN